MFSLGDVDNYDCVKDAYHIAINLAGVAHHKTPATPVVAFCTDVLIACHTLLRIDRLCDKFKQHLHRRLLCRDSKLIVLSYW